MGIYEKIGVCFNRPVYKHIEEGFILKISKKGYWAVQTEFKDCDQNDDNTLFGQLTHLGPSIPIIGDYLFTFNYFQQFPCEL